METKLIHITIRNIEKNEDTFKGIRFSVKHSRLNDGEPIVFELKDEDYNEETRFFAEEQLYYDLEGIFDLGIVRFSKSAKNYILEHFHFIKEEDLPDRVEPFTIEELKEYFDDYELEKLDRLKDDDDYAILCFNRHYEYYVRKASKPGYYDLNYM